MSSRVCLIIYDLPVYISSCLFSLMLSGLLVIPGVSCLWVLPCPVMSCLDVLIKYYILSLYPRLRVPVPPSCVHRDSGPVTNPDLLGQKKSLGFKKNLTADQRIHMSKVILLHWIWKNTLRLSMFSLCSIAWLYLSFTWSLYYQAAKE